MNFIKKYYGLIIIVLGVSCFVFMNGSEKDVKLQNPIDFSDENLWQTTLSPGYIMIDIKGEVKYPGLYEVPENLRVGEVIVVAGGLTEEANTDDINLSQKITDEMEIIIPKKNSTQPNNPYDQNNPIMITVEIKGAVNHPGIYTLPERSVLNDLLEACGGLTDDSDDTDINRLQTLNDGDSITISKKTPVLESNRMIYVKIQGEIEDPNVYYVCENTTLQELIYLAGGVTEQADLNRIDWNIKLCLGAVITIPEVISTNPDSNYSEYDVFGKININYASVETLITLPGIGDILAQRIVDYRSENGYFQAIEDIMYVSGIKSSVYEQIKELITV